MERKAASRIMPALMLMLLLSIGIEMMPVNAQPLTFKDEWVGSVGTYIESFAIGDTNNDRKNELVVYGNDGTVNIYSFDGVEYIRQWYTDIGIITRGSAIGDTDGDHVNEIGAGTQRLEIEDEGFIYLFGFDGSTYVEEWSTEVLSEAGIHDVVIGDIDGDGANEIVTGEYWAVRVFSYTGSAYVENWNYSDGINFWINTGDTDGDKIDEIIVAINGGSLRVFSYNDLKGEYALDWGTYGLGTWPWEVVTGDCDSDGLDEIVVGDDEGVVRIYDFVGSEYMLTYEVDIGRNAYGLAVDDVDLDGLSEVIAGENGGNLYVFSYDGVSYVVDWKTTFSAFIQTVAVGDADNDGVNEIMVGTGHIMHVLGPSPIARFTYSPTYPYVGQRVTFDASSSLALDGTIVSYLWDFGDGSIGTGVVTTHAFQSAGIFMVTLTVTDNKGLTSSLQQNITVDPLPTLTITMTNFKKGTTERTQLELFDQDHDGFITQDIPNRILAVIIRTHHTTTFDFPGEYTATKGAWVATLSSRNDYTVTLTKTLSTTVKLRKIFLTPFFLTSSLSRIYCKPFCSLLRSL